MSHKVQTNCLQLPTRKEMLTYVDLTAQGNPARKRARRDKESRELAVSLELRGPLQVASKDPAGTPGELRGALGTLSSRMNDKLKCTRQPERLA